MKNLLLFCLFTFPFMMVMGSTVKLEVSFHSSDYWRETIKSEIAAQIEEGLLDAHSIFFRFDSEKNRLSGTVLEASVKNGKLLVHSTTFSRLPHPVREQVLNALASYWNRTSYKVLVDQERNDLSKQSIVDRLETDISALPTVVPAEFLLSEYAQRWAYQDSMKHGPNCWHSSMASIFPNWHVGRRMGPEEFSCHLDKSFTQISEPEQFGDLIRLKTNGGISDVHGFTYLGVDRENPNRKIVFTKNGYRRSYYLFMTFEDVKRIYASYAGGAPVLEYYRPNLNVVDPEEGGPDPCDSDVNAVRVIAKDRANPILLYGLRTQPPLGMAPIKY